MSYVYNLNIKSYEKEFLHNFLRILVDFLNLKCSSFLKLLSTLSFYNRIDELEKDLENNYLLRVVRDFDFFNKNDEKYSLSV